MEEKDGYLLIIEDSEIDFIVAKMKIQLENPKLQLINKQNGNEALRFLSNEIDNPTILILLDLNMPICDGFEFMNIYNKTLYSKFPSVPVYVLSSSYNSLDKKRSTKYNFITDYIVKSLNIYKLKEITTHQAY